MKKILLADDSITIQKVVELTFSEKGYRVISVGNGVKAIEKIRTERPDLILCDVIMPEKNGYDVCVAESSIEAIKWLEKLIHKASAQLSKARR